MILLSVIFLIYILVIAPYLLGSLLCYRMEGPFANSYVFRYVTGFFAEVGIWNLLGFPFQLFLNDSVPFHILCYVFFALMLLLSSGCIVLWILKGVSVPAHVACFFEETKKHFFMSKACGFLILSSFCVMGYQIIYLIVSIRDRYVDNRIYISEMLTVILEDKLQLFSSKKLLAPWYGFPAMLSLISTQHPLFIGETLLPLFVLALYYGVMWLLGRYLFDGDGRKTVFFFAGAVYLTFVLDVPLYGLMYYYATHPTFWGKTIFSVIFLPLIYMMYDLAMSEHPVKFYWILLLFVSAGGVFTTLMSTVVLPAPLIAIAGYELIKHRSWKTVWYTAAVSIPLFCQAGAYIFLYIK